MGRTQRKLAVLKQDGFEFVTTIFVLAPEYITPIQSTKKRPFMPDRPNPKKNRNQQSPEDIQVSAISKQTVGAVTGAAIGSVVGPIGAVVGGVVGALAGKAAAGKQPIRKAASRAIAASKRSLKPHPRKRSRPRSLKKARRSRGKSAKRKKSKRSPTAQSRKRMLNASRARPKRLNRRTKRR
jgi:hypothetical protein